MSAIVIYPEGDDLHVMVPMGRPKSGVHWTTSDHQPGYLMGADPLEFVGFATNDANELLATPFENGDQLRDAFLEGLVDDVIVYAPAALPNKLQKSVDSRMAEMVILKGEELIVYSSEGLDAGDTFGRVYPLATYDTPLFLGIKGKLISLFHQYGGVTGNVPTALAKALLDLGKAAQVQGHNIDHTLYSSISWHTVRKFREGADREWETKVLFIGDL